MAASRTSSASAPRPDTSCRPARATGAPGSVQGSDTSGACLTGSTARAVSCTLEVPFQSLRSTRQLRSWRPPCARRARSPPAPQKTVRQVPAAERAVNRRCLPSCPRVATPASSTPGTSSRTEGLPRPCGSELRELVGQVERDVGQRHDGVHALDRDQVVVLERRVGVGGEGRGERLDGVGAHRDARRGAVAAPRQQVLGAGGQARRAGRTSAASGPTRGPPRPRGRSARSAGAAARPRALRRCRRRRRASRARRAPGRAAPGARPAAPRPCASASRRISPSTACRSRLRASSTSASSRARCSSVVVSSSSASRGWPSRPAALMRGASRKPISVAPIARGLAAGDAHQRVEPGAARAAQRLEAGAHQRAVLALQRHDVGDGGERHQVELALDDRAVGAGAGDQRLAQLPGDAGAAQIGRVVAAAVRGDDGARGQLVGRPVVVGDHERQPELRPRGRRRRRP